MIGGKLAVIAPGLRHRRARCRGSTCACAWMATACAPACARGSQPAAAPLEAVLDFDRKRGDGTAYAAAKQADLAAWSPLLHVAGVTVDGGRGERRPGRSCAAHRVATVTVDAALDDVTLRGARARCALRTLAAQPFRAAAGARALAPDPRRLAPGRAAAAHRQRTAARRRSTAWWSPAAQRYALARASASMPARCLRSRR